MMFNLTPNFSNLKSLNMLFLTAIGRMKLEIYRIVKKCINAPREICNPNKMPQF